MNLIYDLLTPYGWIGVFAIGFGIYQIISYNDIAIGTGLFKITMGIFVIILNMIIQITPQQLVESGK